MTLLLRHVLTIAQLEHIEIPLIIPVLLVIQAAKLALKMLALIAFLARVLSISNLQLNSAYLLAAQANIHLLLC